MYANTCWGLLTLAAAFGLAVFGLGTEYAWLRPWIIYAAIVCGTASAVCFCWPLLRHAKRGIAKRISRHRNVWAQRDQLELSAIACLSVGKSADEPYDVEPQLSRHRSLKDAVRSGALKTVDLQGSKPNVHTLVTREDLRAYAKSVNHRDLLNLLKKWDQLNLSRSDVIDLHGKPDPAATSQHDQDAIAEVWSKKPEENFEYPATRGQVQHNMYKYGKLINVGPKNQQFVLKFSPANRDSVHMYKEGLSYLARVRGRKTGDPMNLQDYPDAADGFVISVGEHFIATNKFGQMIQGKIVGVKHDRMGADYNEVTFDYFIAPSRGGTFLAL